MERKDPQSLWRLMGQCTVAAESRAPGLTTRINPVSWMVTTEANEWLANWLVCHDLTETTSDTVATCLDQIVASGRTTSLVVGETVGAHLHPLFEGQPMAIEGNPPMMWRDASPVPPNPRAYPGTIQAAAGEEDIRAAVDLIARSFEVDPTESSKAMTGVLDDPAMRMHLAGSDAIDSVCMTYTPARVTYVYIMATDPDRQRRGAGRAVLTAAMDEARAAGSEQFFLMSSSSGQPLYEALGYVTYELPEFWVVNPPPEA